MTAFRRVLLPALVFVTGASILILEVVGLRVLSPFYGNTIYTVSSVISVILLALSVGYYVGGKLADRRPTLDYFFGFIFLGGIALLAFYSLGKVVLPLLSSNLSISLGPLVSATLLFLLPAVLLGMLSPYAVKLQSIYLAQEGVGSATGTIFFWSTLGSIAGSLCAGFVLIPHFGVDRILIANGVLLSAVGLVSLAATRKGKKRLYVAVAMFALGLGGASLATLSERQQFLYAKDGVYQKIMIYDGSYAGRPTRFLQLDENSAGAGEGAMFLDSDDPTDLVYEYTRYYALYKIFKPQVQNALVIGGGAYSVPKALLRELPSATIGVVDIEPSAAHLAKRYFKVPDEPRLHSYVEDGRRFLGDADKQYDEIFSDVYYSLFSVPSQFSTKEFFTLAKERLSPGGILIVNMTGDLSRQQPSLILSEIRTFREVFSNSYFFAVAWPERTDTQNVMLVGRNSETRIDLESPLVTENPDPLIRALPSKLIDVDRRFDLSAYPVLTDDFSPVEFFTAQVLRRAFAEDKSTDGDEMLADVTQQERYGPRYAGSPGHDRTRDFLLTEMKLLAEDVKTQNWQETGPNGTPRQLTNIIARFYMSSSPRIVIAAHYGGGLSTSGSNQSVQDASDASGAAILLELARSFEDSPVPPGVGIDLVFFDSEPGANGGRSPLGARYFAEHLGDLYGDQKPIEAIVLDSLCRSNLQILKPQHSAEMPAAQIAALWSIGQKLNARAFLDRSGPPEVAGEQTVLTAAGIPAVLLTDSEFPNSSSGWATTSHCSAQSLGMIGQTLLTYITRPAKAFDRNEVAP